MLLVCINCPYRKEVRGGRCSMECPQCGSDLKVDPTSLPGTREVRSSHSPISKRESMQRHRSPMSRR